MRICIVAPNFFSGDDLIIGEEYDAQPISNGSDRQNKAFHALIQEYWRSGCHSYNANNFMHFRELIKLELGAGVEKYYSVVDGEGKKLDKPVIRYRIKSWADYSKKERKDSIDRLIAEMIQAGTQTKKFYEILEGLEKK